MSLDSLSRCPSCSVGWAGDAMQTLLAKIKHLKACAKERGTPVARLITIIRIALDEAKENGAVKQSGNDMPANDQDIPPLPASVQSHTARLETRAKPSAKPTAKPSSGKSKPKRECVTVVIDSDDDNDFKPQTVQYVFPESTVKTKREVAKAGKRDEELQLALALSASIAPADAKSKRGSKAGNSSSAPSFKLDLSKVESSTRKKKRKGQSGVPRVLPAEEARERVELKAGAILYPESDSCECSDCRDRKQTRRTRRRSIVIEQVGLDGTRARADISREEDGKGANRPGRCSLWELSSTEGHVEYKTDMISKYIVPETPRKSTPPSPLVSSAKIPHASGIPDPSAQVDLLIKSINDKYADLIEARTLEHENMMKDLECRHRDWVQTEISKRDSEIASIRNACPPVVDNVSLVSVTPVRKLATALVSVQDTVVNGPASNLSMPPATEDETDYEDAIEGVEPMIADGYGDIVLDEDGGKSDSDEEPRVFTQNVRVMDGDSEEVGQLDEAYELTTHPYSPTIDDTDDDVPPLPEPLDPVDCDDASAMFSACSSPLIPNNDSDLHYATDFNTDTLTTDPVDSDSLTQNNKLAYDTFTSDPLEYDDNCSCPFEYEFEERIPSRRQELYRFPQKSDELPGDDGNAVRSQNDRGEMAGGDIKGKGKMSRRTEKDDGVGVGSDASSGIQSRPVKQVVATKPRKGKKPADVTPAGMPDYKSMTVEELRKIGKKYGLRPGSKVMLVAELSKIWRVLNGHDEQEESNPGPPPAQKPASAASIASQTVSKDDECGDDEDDEEEDQEPVGDGDGDVLEDDDEFMGTGDTDDDDTPMDERLYQYIKSQVGLYSRILRYEPLDFELLHTQVIQTHGLKKCSRRALAAFLDSKSIIYVLPSKPGDTRRRRY
ncbi:hypothetical protein HK104_004392 [Borealophlyctis nickersoniae]|nr:hypothetical protein HK104_004392 [Borealophlyctis nickersoniae]